MFIKLTSKAGHVSSNGFSVPVFSFNIDDVHLSALLKVTDWLIESNEVKWDYSGALAGQITRGKQILIPPLNVATDFLFERDLIFHLFSQLCQTYLQKAPKHQKMQEYWSMQAIEIDDAWCVSQHSGDYNPLHGHDGLVSGVLYLNVPPQINSGNKPDGYLQFSHSDPVSNCIDSTKWDGHLFDFATATNPPESPRLRIDSVFVRPVIGECWIFPSWLLHQVAAFKGEGERRSVAFNARRALRPEIKARGTTDVTPGAFTTIHSFHHHQFALGK